MLPEIPRPTAFSTALDSTGEVLLTGSYNWTRSAALYNRENLLVTREARLVEAFGRDFDALWGDLERWSSS